MPANSLFGAAPAPGKPAADQCKFCQQPVGARYYLVNGGTACASCAEKAQREGSEDSHGAFMRALLVGIVAAIIGLALYATFEITTGITIGYLSLGVGFLIGKGMMLASKGVGGRRYQIAAVLLTYCAVSLAAIPVALSQYAKQQERRGAQPRTDAQTAEQQNQSGAQSSSPDGQSRSQAETTSNKPDSESKMSVGAIWGYWILIGLASPFLELQDPWSGLIGLVILFVGLRIAWRTTAGMPVQVDGPYDSTARVST